MLQTFAVAAAGCTRPRAEVFILSEFPPHFAGIPVVARCPSPKTRATLDAGSPPSLSATLPSVSASEGGTTGLPRLPSPLQDLRDERLERRGVHLRLKRDDLISSEIPGNKWRKLRHNLQAAREQGCTRLLTFGGAYSNHIRATAAAGRRWGFDTVGVIRGEEHLPLNDSLAFAAGCGMTLTYLDRTTYRRKTEPAVVAALVRQFGPSYVLPEGGSNGLAVRGTAELVGEITTEFDVICCATGTGGTLAGIAAGLSGPKQALGFAVLNGAQYLDAEVRRLQQEAFGTATANWTVDFGFSFGGYAKRTTVLDDFVLDFGERHGVTLDRVYEAKMMYGIFARAEAGDFPPGTRIIAVLS
ncbi:1-aminocyclopropane-1-carboxylate deaminase/D-cysteine desulfhydrase [Amycolatopsis tolypomycina]|uniref:1-aminocyclopropane-1-carboxylate deaminase/D-cysteine desulfhydrase n=1 Tax=Amycolatopsis tolypomycina TaxID=208445 RepID=UPI0033B0B873